MIKRVHGGTGWLDGIDTDLSASVNALPLPSRIKEAAVKAADLMGRYPDPEYAKLRETIGALEGADPELVVCGNGASELFTAAVRAYSPRRIGLFDPCYSGYEGACPGFDLSGGPGSDCERFLLSEENGFVFDERAVRFARTADIDMLFLPDPNNPTGRLIPPGIKEEILNACAERGVTVVLDECFMRLTSGSPAPAASPGVLRVNAFTKIFAVPGARIGYLIAGTPEEADRIRLALPEWNLSCFSEAVGITCAEELMSTDFEALSLTQNTAERARLSDGIASLGIKVYPSDANYILIKFPGAPGMPCEAAGTPGETLRGRLAARHGILLRSCADFRGLGPDFLRISVGKPEDNDKLLAALKVEMSGCLKGTAEGSI